MRNPSDSEEPEEPPPHRCLGCWWHSQHASGCEPVFVDRRTGRQFCHEHVMVLASWEMDGCPEADGALEDLAEWIGKENVQESMGRF